MATPALDHVLRHNAWANKELLELCVRLDPATLALSVPGTYGTLQRTVQHIVGGEQFYILLLTGEVVGTPAGERHTRTIAELLVTSTLTGARAIAIAASDDADRPIKSDGDPTATTVGTVLAQLVNHANEHRAQAATILGAHGRETPVLSAWRYGIKTGISKLDGD